MADIGRELESIYQYRRDRASRELDAKVAEVYGLIPELTEIDEQITMAGIKHAQALIRGLTPDDPNSLALTLSALNQKKETLLKANGYSPDYLMPTYTCNQCRDTGSIMDETSFDTHPCSCYQQLYLEKVYKVSNILDDGQTGLAHFNEGFYSDKADKKRYGLDISPRDQILRVREQCEAFVAGFARSDSRNLYFYGPTGTGKTHMAKSIGLELMKMGYTVLYLSAPTLFDVIRKARMLQEMEDADTTYKSLVTTQLLILDDLGTEPYSDARYAEFLTLLEARKTQSQYHIAKTIISSNLDMKRLYHEYNERIASRIAGECDALQFIGDDIRIIKKYY